MLAIGCSLHTAAEVIWQRLCCLHGQKYLQSALHKISNCSSKMRNRRRGKKWPCLSVTAVSLNSLAQHGSLEYFYLTFLQWAVQRVRMAIRGVRTDIQASRVLMPMATLHDLILNRNKRHPNLGRELSLLGRRWKKSTKGFTSLQFELFKAPGVSFCTHSTYNNDIFKLPQLIPMIAVLPISTTTWNKQLKQLPPQAIGKRVEKGMTARKP